jgi:hypothetical protein
MFAISQLSCRCPFLGIDPLQQNSIDFTDFIPDKSGFQTKEGSGIELKACSSLKPALSIVESSACSNQMQLSGVASLVLVHNIRCASQMPLGWELEVS